MKKFVFVLMSAVFFVALSAGFTAAPQEKSSVNTAELNTSLPLPEIIDSYEANENSYVGRLTAMEQDLNSFVFANKNGTQTLRIFNHPVKYTDKNGETKDITLDIEPASGGDFMTKNNSIVTTFKKKLTEGISLEYNDIDLLLKPKAATDGFTASLNGKTVTYPYGENTSLEYSLTYTGFKEDIVVEEYTGQTEYKFALLTNGYKVEKIGESYKVTDGEGNIKANIGEIIIFTADERNNTFGELRCEEVRQNEEYLLTVVIDGEYLSDPNTAYPIRIDPTVEINYSDSGESAIQDVTINSTGGSDGSSTALRIGKRENYGISRVLMKFPGLASYQGLTGVELIKASVELRDIMCESESLAVNCHLFTGNAWSESTANWSNVNPNSYNSSLLSSATVSYSNGLNQHSNHRYSFDITSAVSLWVTNTAAFNKGVILKATDAVENGSSFISKTFSSYERSANQPSLKIVYSSGVSITKTIDYVKVGNSKTITYTSIPTNISLNWSSSNPAVATVNSFGTVTGIKPGVSIVNASYYDSALGVTCSDSITIYVMNSAGIEDGTCYYIMNYASLKLMSLDEPADISGTNVSADELNSSSMSRWTVETQNNGSYQLISEYSTTEKVLNVDGTNINLYADTNQATSKFEICRAAIQGYDGYYIILYGSYFVAQGSNNNICLTSTFSQYAIWSLMAVEKGESTFFSFNYINEEESYNTSTNDSAFLAIMLSEGFTSHSFTNSTAEIAYEYLTEYDEVYVFNGHGGAGIIEFRDSTGNTSGAIAVNQSVASRYIVGNDRQYIDDCTDNQLASLRIALYLGCNTGNTIEMANGKKYNLVDATYEKGAHFVLGTTESLFPADHVAWTEYFLDALDFGYSVGEAVESANISLGVIHIPNDATSAPFDTVEIEEMPLYCVGDKKQYIETDW